MRWFTADPHFSHKNLLAYCSRPFKSVHALNEAIVENYNQVVKPEDEVFFLGDLCMFSPNSLDRMIPIMERLPGSKHLILGNHDSGKPWYYVEQLGFTSVHTSLELEIKGNKYYLVHDPAAAQFEGRWICGHVHNLFLSTKTEYNALIVNTGVDVWDFKPVSEDDLVKEFELL